MLTMRPSDERGHFDFGWLNTYHSFSFGQYFDRNHMGFRSLRVINEDVVAPGAGFPQHPHDNMEIITYIVSGQLAHKDTLGSGAVIGPGDVQYMAAGTGIEHSEFNPSKTEPAHLLQIWIKPAARDLKPNYAEAKFLPAQRTDQLRLVASPDGAEGSMKINQDARLFASLLSEGKTVKHPLGAGRHAWLQVVRGGLTVNGQGLRAGDAVAASDEKELSIAAGADSEFLLFDLG